MPTFASTVSGGLRRLVARSDQAARRRREQRHLLEMSDRQLLDIGITREQIPGIYGR
jgi:uncharacterized protein YjiS (DUF1127 family)